MSSRKTAPNGGCWTCKLRRKKCDEAIPKCTICSSLEIECKYGTRPSWMDGADAQKQRATTLKNEIKQKAARKREKANVTDMAPKLGFDVLHGMVSDYPEICKETSSGETTLVASLPWCHRQQQSSETLDQASASEMNFITKYLDFFFPALFPYYRPHVFDSGRSWLLTLLRKSRIAYHAILGLSCYYFTMELADVETGGELVNCKLARWEEVERETRKCFESLRSDVAAFGLGSRSLPVTTRERVELLAGITQVITFEMSMGRAEPWKTHLPAAITLFEEVMASPTARSTYGDQPQSDFSSILLGIGDPLWTNPGICNHIWSPNQECFRFCAGLLIFIDVLASTTLQQPPRLHTYHDRVLSLTDDGMPTVGDAEIRLSKIVGCHNGVIRLIAEISSLAAWKKSGIPHDFSDQKLHELSVKIDHDLQTIIDAVTTYDPQNPRQRPSFMQTRTSTLIWAFAARSYLRTVAYGWHLSDPELRRDTSKIITLLGTVAAEQMRTLAWPFCLAGCLATQSQEDIFLGFIVNLPKSQRAGALDDVQRILRDVWQLRSILDPSTWTLASCLAVTGSPVLIA